MTRSMLNTNKDSHRKDISMVGTKISRDIQSSKTVTITVRGESTWYRLMLCPFCFALEMPRVLKGIWISFALHKCVNQRLKVNGRFPFFVLCSKSAPQYPFHKAVLPQYRWDVPGLEEQWLLNGY